MEIWADSLLSRNARNRYIPGVVSGGAGAEASLRVGHCRNAMILIPDLDMYIRSTDGMKRCCLDQREYGLALE